MIKCPYCQVKYPENTLFCEECGSYLLGGERQETDALAFAEVTWRKRKKTSEVLEEEVTSPLGLKLTILDRECEVEVPLTKKEVSIGRLDPTVSSFPDVDLASYSAGEKGVSRRHAKIARRGREVFIEDLGSINGTFLNRKRLTPFLPKSLKSGDELQLGTLALRVSFR